MEFKTKLVIGLICAVLGVPSSIWAYEWTMYKLSKQMMNCAEDFQKSFLSLDFGSSVSVDKDLAKVAKSFDECRTHVDIRKGTYPFLKEEIHRARENQP